MAKRHLRRQVGAHAGDEVVAPFIARQAVKVIVAGEVEGALVVGRGRLHVVHHGAVRAGDVVGLQRVVDLAVEVLDRVAVDVLIDRDAEVRGHVDGQPVGIGVDRVQRAAVHRVGHLRDQGRAGQRAGRHRHRCSCPSTEVISCVSSLALLRVAPVDDRRRGLEQIERDDVVRLHRQPDARARWCGIVPALKPDCVGEASTMLASMSLAGLCAGRGPPAVIAWNRKSDAGLSTGTAMIGVICGMAVEPVEIGGRNRSE